MYCIWLLVSLLIPPPTHHAQGQCRPQTILTSLILTLILIKRLGGIIPHTSHGHRTGSRTCNGAIGASRGPRCELMVHVSNLPLYTPNSRGGGKPYMTATNPLQTHSAYSRRPWTPLCVSPRPWTPLCVSPSPWTPLCMCMPLCMRMCMEPMIKTYTLHSCTPHPTPHPRPPLPELSVSGGTPLSVSRQATAASLTSPLNRLESFKALRWDPDDKVWPVLLLPWQGIPSAATAMARCGQCCYCHD